MKLLHLALGNHNLALWKAFDNHFETKHYNWVEKNMDFDGLNKDILKVYNDFKPDVVFMQIQGEGIISSELCEYMTINSITANWTGDVRYPLPEWFVDIGKKISVTLFNNIQNVLFARERGINADFLQVGFDSDLFTPYGTKKHKPDIVFMGSNYITNNPFPLSKLRYDLVQKLRTKYGEDFFSYGANWEGISPDFYFAYPNEESEIYRNCKIAINLSHFDYSRYSSDRLLRLMGSGAFCLSHNFKGIERDFDIKNHLDVWSDIDELISKIDYYLKNEYERESIAKEGCIFVRENCNWDKRIEELKKMIC